jgi:hypothetical protein
MPGNKYGAVRTWSERYQRWFASKAEAERAEELHLYKLAGEICSLELQPRWVLSTRPRITYAADFLYHDCKADEEIVEDVKGSLTRDTRTKLSWLKEKHGVTVRLIRRVRGGWETL